MAYYSTINEEWNLTIYNNRDGPWGNYAKWNKLEKDKHHATSLICKILKQKTQAYKYRELIGVF